MDPLMPGRSIPLPSRPQASSSLAARRRVDGAADNAEAARQIEGLFLGEMLKAMRKSVPESGLMSGGRGEDVMRSFQDEALAQSMAAQGGFGLAAHLLKAMDRMDGVAAKKVDSGTGENSDKDASSGAELGLNRPGNVQGSEG